MTETKAHAFEGKTCLEVKTNKKAKIFKVKPFQIETTHYGLSLAYYKGLFHTLSPFNTKENN